MKQIMYRICPRRTLTLNNRWHFPVYPKHSIFFIPYDGGYIPNQENNPANKHIKAWINFLKFTKHRSVLFLFTLNVEYYRREDRILKVWHKQELQEIIIPERFLGHIRILKVQSV